MNRLHRPLATLLTLCVATAARALDIAPVGDPEALGFSSSRLARIAAWQQSQVDAGAFSGAVAAIARNGKVAYLRAVGFRDHAKTIPLQTDAIFWIASMSKPVTSVGAHMSNGAVASERLRVILFHLTIYLLRLSGCWSTPMACKRPRGVPGAGGPAPPRRAHMKPAPLCSGWLTRNLTPLYKPPLATLAGARV
jgi:hypothetical protein